MRPSTTEVRLGTVFYLGVSDTPALVEARMQILAGVRRFGERPGETDQKQSRHRASGRLNPNAGRDLRRNVGPDIRPAPRSFPGTGNARWRWWLGGAHSC
jgi:hypothetical protein